ncbi:hypothetical protein L916_21698 [Phytophthora nicotianae]|nr:hypothetical protein L916_21698 [Phytophthora nicotianae]
MRVGMQAERCLFEFFGDHGIKSRNGSSVLKQLRKLHREGKLELLIKAYVARVNIGKISDPAPNHVQNAFAHNNSTKIKINSTKIKIKSTKIQINSVWSA